MIFKFYNRNDKNQETIGLSSVPDDSKPLGLTLDQEILELIKKLGPKK